MLGRLLARKNSRRSEHDNRIAHLFAAQPLQRIDIFRGETHSARRRALHEYRIAIRRYDFLGLMPALHESSVANDRSLTFYATRAGKNQQLSLDVFRRYRQPKTAAWHRLQPVRF